MSVGNSYHRFADRYQSRLDDWANIMTTKYERRGRPHIEILPLDTRPKPEPKEPREIIYQRPPVDGHKQVKIHSVIDVHAWDQAKWHGVGYLRFDPEYPPVLALLFKNEEAARAIFSAWHERVGPADRNNQIRVAIIRNHNPDRPSHYIVQIASTPPKPNEMEPGQSFVMASRCLENTPEDDVNLTRFLRDHADIGAYYLAAGIMRPGKDSEPKWLDGMILKRELSVKRASDVDELDVEAIALRVIHASEDRAQTSEQG